MKVSSHPKIYSIKFNIITTWRAVRLTSIRPQKVIKQNDIIYFKIKMIENMIIYL